jgi:hypothetical protein
MSIGAQIEPGHPVTVGTQKFTTGTQGNTFTVDGTTKTIGRGNPVRIC